MMNGHVTAFAKFIQWLMLLQLLAAHDCWRECGGRGGWCELFCGQDGACCRGGWAQDPVECGAATKLPDPNGHTCVPVDRALAEDCWSTCGKKSGYCEACGLGKACCKAGLSDSPEECKAATSLYHQCTDAPPKMCEALGVMVPCSTVTFSSTTRTTTILTTTAPTEHHQAHHALSPQEEESGFPRWAWPLIFLPIIIAALMTPLLMGSCGCWPANQKHDTASDVLTDEDEEELHTRLVDGGRGPNSATARGPYLMR